MYAIEKKFEIEMKLKKEMSNIAELKAAASRSSALAGDVCNVLGACEQRLQQLETAVLPLYGDTARLQQIHTNMERTVKALDHVINYYMVSRELADLVQAGPHTSNTDTLNIYLEALDKLAEAQNYFNKNNPQSVELENINQLYNTGVLKLETAFEELLNRNTRPLSPTTLMDMIALEEDSSADSVSVSGSTRSSSGAGAGAGAGAAQAHEHALAHDTLRAAAAWLSAAARPPVQALLAARAPAARQALTAFKDYLKARSVPHDPIMRAKNLLHRSDSTTKKTSKIQKVIEKRANKIIQKASQTFENSTGLAIGPRRSVSESYTEESYEALEEWEATLAGSVAAALARLARHEQRALLGLVPLPRLPPLLAQILHECFATLHQDVEVDTEEYEALEEWEATLAGSVAAALARLARHEQRALLGLVPLPRLPPLLAQILHECFATLHQDVEVDTEEYEALEEWEATLAGSVAAALARLARHEQRALLGLVPLPRLPPLLAQILHECFATLHQDVEVDTEEYEALEEWEATLAGSVAAALARLARHEQRALLGLVPLPRLPPLLAQILHECFATLHQDVEVDTEEYEALEEWEATLAGSVAAALARLARHEQRALLGLVPLPRLPPLLAQILHECFATLHQDVEVDTEEYEALEEWEATLAGSVAAALARLARHEQRALLGLVPLPRLLPLLAQILHECFATLHQDVEVDTEEYEALEEWEATLAGSVAAALARLARHEQRALLGLVPLPRLPPLLAQILHECLATLHQDVEVDTEEYEALEEWEATLAGSVAAALARLARHEQRALLGLVPLLRLPPLLAQILHECFATLHQDVEVDTEEYEALEEWEATLAGSVAAALARLARHEQRALLGLVPLPRLPPLLAQILHECFATLHQDVEVDTEEYEALEEWEATLAGSMAAALARHEQRALLGLVPLPRLPPLLAQILHECFATLHQDVEVDTEEYEALEEWEATLAGSVAAALARLARHEQRALLGLVPLPRLPPLLAQILHECFATLHQDVEVDTEEYEALEEWEATLAGSVAAALARLARHEQRALLGLVPLPRLSPLLAQILHECFATLHQDVEVDTEEYEALEEWEATLAGSVAAALARLARHEQRALLGLVPLPRLPPLLAQILHECFATLHQDVEVDTEEYEALEEWEATLAGSVAAALARLARHEQRALLGLVPLPRLPPLLAQILHECFATLHQDVEVDTEEYEALEEWEATLAGSVAAALARLARHEQRALLGLVPLPRLPPLLAQILHECFATLHQDVERACQRSRRACARSSCGASACWALLARLQRLQPDVARALAPAEPTVYTSIVNSCHMHCLKSLEEWVEGLRSDTAAGAVDGTVHQLAVAALAHCHTLARHLQTIGPALATEPLYSCALPPPGAPARDAALLGLYVRKVLAQLNLVLRNKSEQYPDALKAIFLLNNTLYLLQGLQRSGLIEVLVTVEPDCETTYRDMIHEYKNNYLQSWNKLLAHTVLEEAPPAKLRDRDRQILKDKFASFNREWEECTKAQRSYSVPDPELREALKRDNKEALLPPYTKFYDTYGSLPFSKNPDKYVKYSPVQIATQLDGYFDEAA